MSRRGEPSTRCMAYSDLRHDDVRVWATNSSRVEYHGVVKFARVARLGAKYGENIHKVELLEKRTKISMFG